MTLKTLQPAHVLSPALGATVLDFELPPELEASEPPEARGKARDEVRLMVSYRSDDRVEHATFRDLPEYLEAGDVVVINTSGTMNAAINVIRADGSPLELHLSTHLPADLWIVEARQPSENGSQPFGDITPGEVLRMPGGASATLHVPYRHDHGQGRIGTNRPARLWIATLDLARPLQEYLTLHGFPIRYGYVREEWPISYYQSVYVTEAGSAEMPSAGRAFTPELMTKLIAKGVQMVPLVLHTGVASLEAHEPPYEEYYRVPLETARAITAARAAGRRVIAVGTTVIRALETVIDREGNAHPGDGWTTVVITPERGIRAVNGLLTGFHEPKATHLAMLEALTGAQHLEITYAEALAGHYLWHEFGDLHLILP
jgi:S-adenosylmethionine:tRNA ribosyltransferase-isomerase